MVVLVLDAALGGVVVACVIVGTGVIQKCFNSHG